MKWLRALIVAALCLPSLSAVAWWQSIQQVVVSIGGFTGACEVSGVTCVAYYAVQACATNAYSGNVADIVDAATGNTTGTRLQCSAGVVSEVISGSACTFVTGNACSSLATTCATSCTHNLIYNQMGTGTMPNLEAPTLLANRARINISSLNSKACWTSSSATVPAAASLTTFTLAQPFSIASVSMRNAGPTTTGRIFSDGGGTNNIGYRNSANTVGFGAGAVVATASDNAFHSLTGVFNGASSVMAVDGAGGTAGTSAQAFSASAPIILNDSQVGAGSAMQGFLCEALVANSALNSTQYGALSTNARLASRWGNSF